MFYSCLPMQTMPRLVSSCQQAINACQGAGLMYEDILQWNFLRYSKNLPTMLLRSLLATCCYIYRLCAASIKCIIFLQTWDSPFYQWNTLYICWFLLLSVFFCFFSPWQTNVVGFQRGGITLPIFYERLYNRITAGDVTIQHMSSSLPQLRINSYSKCRPGSVVKMCQHTCYLPCICKDSFCYNPVVRIIVKSDNTLINLQGHWFKMLQNISISQVFVHSFLLLSGRLANQRSQNHRIVGFGRDVWR